MNRVELTIIKAALDYPDMAVADAASLEPDDFSTDFGKDCWEFILAGFSLSKPVTEGRLISALKKSGYWVDEYKEDFVAMCVLNPLPGDILECCAAIKDSVLRRKMALVADKMKADATGRGDASAAVTEAIESLSGAQLDGKGDDVWAARKMMKDAMSDIEERYESRRSGKNPLGHSTGLKTLDDLVGGIGEGHYWIVAGRPGMGKTSLAMGMALHAATTKKVLFVSLEMSRRDLQLRALSHMSKVELEKLRAGRMGQADWPRIPKAAKQIAEGGLHMVRLKSTAVSDVRACIARQRAASGIDIVVIDYLQMMVAKSAQNREREISQISAMLNGIKALGMSVIALSQLNRACEARVDKRPMLADLRDSGSLEQDTDVVLAAYRDEFYNPETEASGKGEIICLKNRHGSTGTAVVEWKKECASFFCQV